MEDAEIDDDLGMDDAETDLEMEDAILGLTQCLVSRLLWSLP